MSKVSSHLKFFSANESLIYQTRAGNQRAARHNGLGTVRTIRIGEPYAAKHLRIVVKRDMVNVQRLRLKLPVGPSGRQTQK